ncbi:putative transcription factor B3-Domain family [Dioscorea sansibarensis]
MVSLPLCFFKIMIGNFSDAMFIPPICIGTLEVLLDKYCSIEDSNGQIWEVKLSLLNGSMAFTHGWRDFVFDHSIVVGELVVFRYANTGTKFHAQIFSTTGAERVKLIQPENCHEELHLDKTVRRSSVNNSSGLQDQEQKEKPEMADHCSNCCKDDRKRKRVEVETNHEELHLNRMKIGELSENDLLYLNDSVKKELEEKRLSSASPSIGLFSKNFDCKVTAESKSTPKKSQFCDDKFEPPKPPFSATENKPPVQPIDKDYRKNKEVHKTYSRDYRKTVNNGIPKYSECRKVHVIEKHGHKLKSQTVCGRYFDGVKTKIVKKERCPAPDTQPGSSQAPINVESSKFDIKKVFPVECSKMYQRTQLPDRKMLDKRVHIPERGVMRPIKSHNAEAECTEVIDRTQNPSRGILNKYLLTEDGVCHIIDDDSMTEPGVRRSTPVEFCMVEKKVSACRDGGVILPQQVAMGGSSHQDGHGNHMALTKKKKNDHHTKSKLDYLGTSSKNLIVVPGKKKGHDMIKGKVAKALQGDHGSMVIPSFRKKNCIIKCEELNSFDLHHPNSINTRFSFPVNSLRRLEMPKKLPFSLGRTPHSRKVIILKDPSMRLWPVLYLEDMKHIISGWKEFAAANKIHRGDVCEFELINESEYILQVRIIKK